MGPTWPFLLVCGPGVIIQVVFLVELLVQRRLCSIFVKSWVSKKGTQWCGVELLDIHEYSAG